jgi:hypothetical protein
MQQNPNRAFGATQDGGYLRGRHLVDEAERDRPAAILRQTSDRLPGCVDRFSRRGGIDEVTGYRDFANLVQ